MGKEMKLTYFNTRGRAEMIRLLFKLGGIEFTDNRVSREEWEKLKPTTPMGYLPILEVDGKVMCETGAINRFVAREADLYGANEWEKAEIDMVLECNTGVFQAMIAYKFTAKTEEEKAEAMKSLQKSLETLEKMLVWLKKGKFLHGDKASIADTSLYVILEGTQTVAPEVKFDICPTVNEIAKSFGEIPAIAEWIKTRPQTDM